MRKSIEYIVEDGKDKGKVFVITRMSAFAADEWAGDLIQALSDAGTRLGKDTSTLGMTGVGGMIVALLGKLNREDRKKIERDLIACCQIKRDPRNPLVEPTKILDVDIEDAMTITRLREKALSLHVDFIRAAASQTFLLAAAALIEETPEEDVNG